MPSILVNLVEKGSDYIFFWKGKPDGKRIEAAVGFAIRSSLVQTLEDLPLGFSEGIISCRIPLDQGHFITLVSVYAPTMSHTPDECPDFYASLSLVVSKVPFSDKLAILGDFNARVGRDNTTWQVLGAHDIGNCNCNGIDLLTFCTQHNLCITNTLFRQKTKHKTTWMHPRSKSWHLLEYILTRKREIKDIRQVCVMPGEEFWTDHRLVRAKLSLVSSPKQRFHAVALPKRLDIPRCVVQMSKKLLLMLSTSWCLLIFLILGPILKTKYSMLLRILSVLALGNTRTGLMKMMNISMNSLQRKEICSQDFTL